MQRNTQDTTRYGDSKYARKVRTGNMMYGNGKRCCGHRHVPGILARLNEADEVAVNAQDE